MPAEAAEPLRGVDPALSEEQAAPGIEPDGVVGHSGVSQRAEHFRPDVGVARPVLPGAAGAEFQQKTVSHGIIFHFPFPG